MSATTTLVDALRQHGRARPSRAGLAAIAAALSGDASLHAVWLTLAVLEKVLPTEPEVQSAHRRLGSDGAAAVVALAAKRGRKGPAGRREVELLLDNVLVDVRHTAETALATGIQRVARETARRWNETEQIVLVTWTDDGKALRRLLPAEQATALYGERPVHGSTRKVDAQIIVPVDGTYLLPELAAESWRTERVGAFAQFGNMTTAVIGFDCVPLTTAETVGEGMPGAFALNLAAVAHMSKVGTISEAAAVEYRGWRDMLAATGLVGPDIQKVMLAAEPHTAQPEDEAEFASLAGLVEGQPLVVVVGSHEPRKNHMALLYAAEALWRQGLDFRLAFIGGNSWNSFDFSDRVEELQAAGRPLVALSSLPDRMLWAAYRAARFTAFPSINEGFGLPIAESIACGTPVLTSDFGSMKEVGEGHGALLVDSRDDEQIVSGMRTLLTDDGVLDTLKAEAAGYVVRTWNQYADDLWQYFVKPTA